MYKHGGGHVFWNRRI